MSQNYIEQISCPVCHYDSPMTIWNYIDGISDPELKEKFLNEEIYDWKCEVCGHKAKVPFGTIYVDYENRIILFYYPIENEDAHESFLGVSITGEFDIKNFTKRKVVGINNLKEKLLIFEAGMNDIAIERLKYFQRMDKEFVFLPDDSLYFLGIDYDPELCKENKCERGFIKFIILRNGYEPRVKVYQAELYYDYLLAVNKDPRMQPEACPNIDFKWMDKKLRING